MKIFVFEFCIFFTSLAWLIKWPDFSGAVCFTAIAIIFGYVASKEAEILAEKYLKVRKK